MKSGEKPPALRFWMKYFVDAVAVPALMFLQLLEAGEVLAAPNGIAWLGDALWSTALPDLAT